MPLSVVMKGGYMRSTLPALARPIGREVSVRLRVECAEVKNVKRQTTGEKRQKPILYFSNLKRRETPVRGANQAAGRGVLA